MQELKGLQIKSANVQLKKRKLNKRVFNLGIIDRYFYAQSSSRLFLELKLLRGANVRSTSNLRRTLPNNVWISMLQNVQWCLFLWTRSFVRKINVIIFLYIYIFKPCVTSYTGTSLINFILWPKSMKIHIFIRARATAGSHWRIRHNWSLYYFKNSGKDAGILFHYLFKCCMRLLIWREHARQIA